MPRRPDLLTLSLTVSAGAAEMVPLAAWVIWLATLFGSDPSHAPGWLALTVTWLTGFAFARCVLTATHDPTWARALAVLGWLAWTLAWWVARVGEPQAILTFLPSLLRLKASIVGLLALSALVWWRTLALAGEPRPFQGDYLRWAVLREAGLVLGITLAALASGGPAAQAVWDNLAWGAPLLVLLRLMTAALIQAEAVRLAYPGAVTPGPWVLRSLLVAAGALGVGALLSLFAAPTLWPRIAGPVEWFLTLLVAVIVTFTVALAVIVWTALRFLVWVVRTIAGSREPGPPPSPPTLPELTRPQEAMRDLALPPWVLDLLVGLVGIVLLLVLVVSIARAFRRYRTLPVEPSVTELRERVALGELRNLLPRLHLPFPSGVVRRRITRPTDVRSAYRAALALFARRGLSRRPSETPSQLAQRVVAVHPAVAAPLTDLTRRYLWSRYGELESAEDRLAALADWQELEQTLVNHT
ncbi:MAG: DUF4129 domain-containing protein [Thermomicrobium sp.]